MAPNHPALLFVLALADPVGQGGLVLERLSKIAVPADPEAAQMAGAAAQAVWAHALSIRFLTPAVAGLRAMGALGTLAQTLVMQAWGCVHVANPPLGLSAAEEAETLARETGQPRWVAAATLARASIAAMRGESSAAEILATEVERTFLPPALTRCSHSSNSPERGPHSPTVAMWTRTTTRAGSSTIPILRITRFSAAGRSRISQRRRLRSERTRKRVP